MSILPIEGLGVDKNLFYEEVLVEILDRQVEKMRNKEVASVKNFNGGTILLRVQHGRL